MKHFFANLAVMFIVFPKLRRRIRAKIMGKRPNQNFDTNMLSEKQKSIEYMEQQYKYLHLKSEWLTHNSGKLLIPGRFTEYDLILPIGATCLVSSILDYFKLRRFASPFDRTAGMAPENWHSLPNIYRDSRFREKIQALCDNFSNWLNPEDFKYVSQWIKDDNSHHHIVNIKTKIRYIHEFPINEDIAQHMPEFIEKTKRRIKHLDAAIKKSNRILIVWVSSIWEQRTVLEQNVSDKDIKWAISRIKKLYPGKIFDLIFFEPDGTKNRFEYEKIKITPEAFRIKSNHFLIDNEYNFVHPVPIGANPHLHVISEALDNIHLSPNAFSLEDIVNVE